MGSWRGDAGAFRFQPPIVEWCMRSFRTRFTDALHRRCLAGASKAYCGDPNPSSLRMRDAYVWVLKPSAGTPDA